MTVRAFDALGLPRTGITAVSMPGFGTTHRTKSNAESLARDLGVSFREVSIHAAVEQHFKDIEHDPAVQDVTYENSQARERTQILMDLANQAGGFVIGTGDLSELALGWATYNGDHMSMYAVNASVPKTLVRHLVRYAADVFGGRIAEVLLDILDTPVSPELLPPTGDGEIAQKTEIWWARTSCTTTSSTTCCVLALSRARSTAWRSRASRASTTPRPSTRGYVRSTVASLPSSLSAAACRWSQGGLGDAQPARRLAYAE